MNSKHQKIFFLLLALLLVCQSEEPQNLEAGVVYEAKLKAEQHLKFSFKIDDHQAGQNFYIEASSPFNDPYEEPLMVITSSDSYEQQCYEQANDYTGICYIKDEDLTPDREFILDLFCIVDCDLKVAGYYNNVVKMDLGETRTIIALPDFGLAQVFQLDLSEDLEFDTIEIVGFIDNYMDVNEGLEMYINFGNLSSLEVPSPNQYMEKGGSVFGHAVGLFLSSEDEVSAGESIYIYLFSGANLTVSFTARAVSMGVSKIEVGYPFVDFASFGKDRIYELNLTEELLENNMNSSTHNYTLDITVITYSGNPEIEVSFDPSFPRDKSLENFYIETALNYQITPEVRQEFGFTGMVYIKVTSFWSTNFYVIADINDKDFILLEQQITELNQLPSGVLKNFIYEDLIDSVKEKDGTLNVQYKLMVQMIGGNSVVGLRPCLSLARNNSLDCLITNPEVELNNQTILDTFSEINQTLVKMFNTYEISFTYNVSQCPKYMIRNINYYLCAFHIFAYNKKEEGSEGQDLFIGLEMRKNSILHQLKEGEIERGTVNREEYNFYSFQLVDMTDIESIEFFTTTIQGDVALFLSQSEKFPNLSTEKAKMSVFGSIQLNKYNDPGYFAAGMFYLSVYGYQVSDYTISVIIERKRQSNATPDNSSTINNNTAPTNHTDTEITVINLQQGRTQSYTIPVNKTQKLFRFTPSSKDELSSITVTDISGSVVYSVYKDGEPENVICSKKSSDSSSKTCEFESQFMEDYIVNVVGAKNYQQIFTITYSETSSCDLYPINFPLFVSLEPSKQKCYLYTLADLDDIEISLSLTALQILTQKIKVHIKVNTDHSIAFAGHERIITKEELLDFCGDETGVAKRCNIEVTFQNRDTEFPASFLVAVQTVTGDSVLFDGSAQKVVTEKLSISSPKRFFYYSFSKTPTKIYLTSSTDSSYRIGAKIVKSSEFVSDFNDELYPSYNSTGSSTIMRNSSPNSFTTVVEIPVSSFNDVNIQSTDGEIWVVLISIYANKPEGEETLYGFWVEVTQAETELPFGGSKLNYIEKDQIYSYKIFTTRANPSVLTVRPIGEDPCFKSYLEELRDQGNNVDLEPELREIADIITFTEDEGYRTVVVKGTTEQCTYQITYDTISTPVLTVQAGIPYDVKIDRQIDLKYFLHYHATNASIRIVQLIDGGSSYLYATPIRQQDEDNIENYINKNLNVFKFRNSEQNSDFIISNGDTNFCFNCYYLIAVKAAPSVDMELIVGPIDMPIPLKQGPHLKDRLQGNSAINTYQFYSISDFKISIDKLYGRFTVTVQSPEGSTIVDHIESLKDHSEYSIQRSVLTENQTIDYFDDRSRFIIIIQSVGQDSAEYTISVAKQESVFKVFEGIPVTLTLQKDTPFTVVFLNVHASAEVDVMLENLNFNDDLDDANDISFAAECLETESGVLKKELIKSRDISQGSYNVRLQGIKGSYFLTMTSNTTIDVSIIVAKTSFTHLIAGRVSLVRQNESVFQIFAPNSSIMVEIFACKGEVGVVSSRNYSLLNEENVDEEGIVKMEHANYGGHYVISANSLAGEYFLKIYSLSEQEVQYQVSYYLYSASEGEQMPYKVYFIPNLRIEYKYHQDNTEFLLSPLARKDHLPLTGQITYKLYISNDTTLISQKTKCSLGQVYTKKIVKNFDGALSSEQKEDLSFTISNVDLKNVIGKDAKGFYVGAEAILALNDQQSFHVSSAYFVYDPIQLLTNNQPEFKQKNDIWFVVIWIVLPFLVGSILLYFAARYLIRSFSAYPTQLIEEDGENKESNFGPSEEGINQQSQA